MWLLWGVPLMSSSCIEKLTVQDFKLKKVAHTLQYTEIKIELFQNISLRIVEHSFRSFPMIRFFFVPISLSLKFRPWIMQLLYTCLTRVRVVQIWPEANSRLLFFPILKVILNACFIQSRVFSCFVGLITKRTWLFNW